eukprot:m.122524 g.122524  ORF g.122524 m.122524 type:complete len:351 (-) comp12939_c1_seq1:84-1136(-)
MRDTYKVGALTSGVVMGAFLGSYFAGAMQERIGRKWTVVLSCSVYLVGVTISFVSLSYVALMMGRLVTGAAVGVLSATIPVYIAELSPKHMRGRLVTANQLFICVGILLGFVVDDAFKCNHNGGYCEVAGVAAWRWMILSGSPIATIVLFMFAFVLPKSPRYLVKIGKITSAIKVLSHFRRKEHIDRELEEIKAASNRHLASWSDLRAPNVLYGLYIGTVLSAIQQFTGTNAVNFYAQTVLVDVGFSQDDAYYFSIYIGIIKVVFVGVGIALIDSRGRRVLMITGVLGMTISTFVLAAVFQVRMSESFIDALRCSSIRGFYANMSSPVHALLIHLYLPLNTACVVSVLCR